MFRPLFLVGEKIKGKLLLEFHVTKDQPLEQP